MKCPNCGGKIEKGDVFCQVCGYQIPQKKAGSKVVILAPLIFLVVVMICIFALLFRTSDEMQDEKAKRKRLRKVQKKYLGNMKQLRKMKYRMKIRTWKTLRQKIQWEMYRILQEKKSWSTFWETAIADI